MNIKEIVNMLNIVDELNKLKIDYNIDCFGIHIAMKEYSVVIKNNIFIKRLNKGVEQGIINDVKDLYYCLELSFDENKYFDNKFEDDLCHEESKHGYLK